MTQVVYRGNMSAAKFPLVSQFQGRTIIVAQYDNVYVPVVASKADEDKDRGIPQIYYCHNVMPTDQGFQSIGYRDIIAAHAMEGRFERIYEIRSGTNKAYFAPALTGNNYIYEGSAWTQINTIGAYAVPTVAYVDGETYIFFAGLGCFTYDFGTNLLTPVTLTGLTIADILGITSAAGYLIAWSLSEVAWSSTIDPTDFVPSLITGAGGGSVQGARGNINVCAPHSLGFIVYTDNNAVAAVYSGNARYPFNFREITGSGGCSSLELISWDSNAAAHYVYSSSGLQLIGVASCQTIFPELTDFLSGAHFEDFSDAFLTFSEIHLTTVMKKKLSIIGDRYLVLSYGIQGLTHALVYDLVAKRWGKLKINHVDCFEWAYFSPELTETPKESLGFIQHDGTVKTVNFSVDNPNADGVLIIGKFQYIRQRLLTMEKMDIENVTLQNTNFHLYNLYAMDGKNWQRAEGYLMNSADQFRSYNFHQTAINHSMVWKGAFHAISFVLHFHIHGHR
jgi:hypothetical protein